MYVERGQKFSNNDTEEYRLTIQRFLSSPDLIRFVKTMRSIESQTPLSSKEYPSCNYFALNFKEDIPVNFKIYFSFNRKLSFQEILRVLPTTTDIEPYYHLFEESKIRDINHTGFTLAAKVNQELEVTYQIHFRFMYSSILPQPKFVKLSGNDYKFSQGISFEYIGPNTLRKNYYYLHSSPAYKTILTHFGEPDRNHLLEYTEAAGGRKIIHWFNTIRDVQDYLNSSICINLQKFTKWVESEYAVTALGSGVYEDQRIRSVYFFGIKPRPDNTIEFYGNSNIETINHLRNKNY